MVCRPKDCAQVESAASVVMRGSRASPACLRPVPPGRGDSGWHETMVRTRSPCQNIHARAACPEAGMDRHVPSPDGDDRIGVSKIDRRS